MKKKFTASELKLLARNPNVYSASEHEIKYTNAFKLHFIKRYLAGDGPAKIFADAGLPASLLGYKRIERACYHWKRAYEDGILGSQPEQPCRPPAKETLMRTITEQYLKIQRLEKELHHYKNKEAG